MNAQSLRSPRKLVASLLVALSLVVWAGTSGCLAVAAGAGAGTAVAYARGQLEVNVSSDYDATTEAANRALQQLGIAKISEHKDALIDLIVARNAVDKKIEIRLENLAKGLTKVRIRIGLFGDEAIAMAILDKIKANL